MKWLITTLTSSMGKKQIMAVTGLAFCLFVAVHLIGNLTIYGGRDLFLSYVDHLHGWGYLLTAAEWGLVLLALLHMAVGLILFIENYRSMLGVYICILVPGTVFKTGRHPAGAGRLCFCGGQGRTLTGLSLRGAE